jgi:signal transduction histidine kinase
MMLPFMVKMPEEMKKVLKNSVKEIKALSERLKTQADAMSFEQNGSETMYLPIILKDLIAQKQLEYSNIPQIKIEFRDETHCSDAFVKGNSIELKSILSNLINNAVESYSDHGGPVITTVSCNNDLCSIDVEDHGVGIPTEYIGKIGHSPISFKGSKGRGLGLTHAFKTVQSWGGKISIQSEVGFGTKVKIELTKKFDLETLKESGSLSS